MKLTNSSNKIPLLITKASQNETNFIIDTWLRSYRKAPATQGIPSQIYYPEHRKLIETTFEFSECLIAKSKENQDQLFGYIVFENTEPKTIHYIYVKKIFRNFGIASELLKAAKINGDLSFFTHKTKQSDFITEENSVFNPYPFYERKNHGNHTSQSIQTNPHREWILGPSD